MTIQKITLRGEQQPASAVNTHPEDQTELKESYLIGSNVRGGSGHQTINLDQEDLVELVFEDGTTWYSNADQLEELFPEAAQRSRSLGGTFELPATLRDGAGERGIVGDVALKVLNIFVKEQVQDKVQDLAAQLEKKQLQNYSGLYRLNRDFSFQKFVPEQTQEPYLIFIHGTSSSTVSSFGGLIGTDVWNFIEQTYGTRVLAFQHETLTKSPLQNAVKLVEELVRESSENIELHIISHSRGGLVGDILSRFSSDGNDRNAGFGENEIDSLKKAERTGDVESIIQLQKLLRNKKITVSKFIRVACPGGGTILASKRLDILLNITMNLVGFGTGVGANPIYASFKNLISAAIDSKNNADVLPGLEAMNPDSPFITVLNSPTQGEVNSPIQVISGNCKIQLELKALLIIASKFFYWQDNDLVVNTPSMYLGTKRTDNLVQYFFDEVGKVDHFNYFKNERTRKAIEDALKTKGTTLVPGFSLIQPELIIRGERQALLKLEDGRIYPAAVTGEKPIVVLLPGIMGSNLSKGNNELWINYWKFIRGELVSLNIENEGVEALSVVKTSYEKLKEYLSAEYDVEVFPFDWRKSLTDTAALFRDKIEELLAFNQPIKIIAHSMGGVLVRDFILLHSPTWQKLNQSPDFRLLFLGSPLGGSFRIPAVLCGRDEIINKLDKIDIFHQKQDLIRVFSRFPGLLNLLPLTTDADNDFAELNTWKKLSEPLGEWPLPQESDLQEFQRYRESIESGLDQIDYSNMIYIAGKDKATPCGYRIDETKRGKELVFLSTGEGDQSVTWESGIPQKMIENETVYYVPVTHGALANEPKIFGGIADILTRGSTHSLSKTRPRVRSDEKVFRSPELYDFDLSPAGVERTILGLEAEETRIQAETLISVSVCHGDLRYATYPVLAGHFLHDGILYAEESIDYYLEGALAERHQLGLYPGEIGSSEIMVGAEQDFKGAIIVGLGKFGELTAYQLAQTVEQGSTRYLLDINSNLSRGYYLNQPADQLGLSSLIIGCGYGGLTIENSVRAVIQGVQNANKKIKGLHGEGAKLLQGIEFIELYEDTALSCFYSLRRIADEENNPLNISVGLQTIRRLFGSRKRLPIEVGEGWWKKLTVQLKKTDEVFREEGSVRSSREENTIRCLQFSASTGGAREEQRELYSSTPIVEQLIDQISLHNEWNSTLAKAVYELLIPNDFKDALKKQGNINWILDKHTASYPWELLQDSASQAKPLCVNAGMIRQLSTQDYRLIVKAVNNSNALVVGDPLLEGFINQLPGALEEGKTVERLLKENEFDVKGIMNGRPPEIIQALFQDDYKIIHLAGHGIFNEKFPESSGMVIGKKVFLSTREICQMSTVPELVFVNCCHLGKTDGLAEEYYRKRYRLAANIGVQLIENGVKAVVAAGWAVDDAAALDFTKVFYESMFAGYNFGDAVLKARKLVYSKYQHTNTWGAYQCYGDPFYKFRNTQKDKKSYAPKFVITQQAMVEFNNLGNELETGSYTHQDFLRRLSIVSEAVDQANIRDAAITEKEALLYADACEYDKALKKFESLLVVEKANFTISTLEKYCNIRAKKYVRDYLDADAKPSGSVQLMNGVIKDLEYLLEVSSTAERHSLLGSTYKRKAVVSNKGQKEKAYALAAYHYRKAHLTQRNTYTAYTLTNWLETESVLVLAGLREWGTTVRIDKEEYPLPSEAQAMKELKDTLTSFNTTSDRMDYWDLVAEANLKLCLLILHPEDAEDDATWNKLLDLFRRLWNKAGSKGKKVSEVEHLELLSDALTLVDNRKADALVEKITQLKLDLERILQIKDQR